MPHDAIDAGGHTNPVPMTSSAKLTPTKWEGNAIAFSPVSFANKQDTRAGTASAPNGGLSPRHLSHLLRGQPRHCKNKLRHPRHPPRKSHRRTTIHHLRLRKTRVKVRRQSNRSLPPNGKPLLWTTSQFASSLQKLNSTGKGPRNGQRIKGDEHPVLLTLPL
jgi:hypothetical protein